jgi:hypothetical protein
MKMIVLLILFLSFNLLANEENDLEVLDPITFKVNASRFRYWLSIIYGLEYGAKKREGIKVKTKKITIRLPCMSIKNISKEKLEEGKKYLKQSILESLWKYHESEKKFFLNLNDEFFYFMRGPDKNGVFLFIPDHRYFKHIEINGKWFGKMDAENLINLGYAEKLETCFSCAPAGRQMKILTEHKKFLKYNDQSRHFYYYLSDNKYSKVSDWKKVKNLCGNHVKQFSQKNYDWMLPEGIFKRAVFGED